MWLSQMDTKNLKSKEIENMDFPKEHLHANIESSVQNVDLHSLCIV